MSQTQTYTMLPNMSSEKLLSLSTDNHAAPVSYAAAINPAGYDLQGERKEYGTPSKNPFKRASRAIKREVEDLKAFNAMTLEEIQAVNSLRAAEMEKKHEVHIQKMEQKFGVVGKTLALGGQATLRTTVAL